MSTNSRMGLAQPGSNEPRKRAPPKNLPKREGDVWKTVTVVQEHPTVPCVACWRNRSAPRRPSATGRSTARSRRRRGRAWMGHAVGDKLVFCHEALHLKNKLQKAGYKQVTEKWDSDSDSDQSNEEGFDLMI